MSDLNEVTWDEAMRRGHTALVASESLYEEINAEAGRSTVDVEQHLRRSEVKAAHA
jgi:predicted transcriptional regulator